MARISFAIPFYSSPAYLDRAVASVRAQTAADWVLVVSDDASPAGDQSVRIAALDDHRIRYVRNRKNVGMAGNWNLCLDRAETDLVTILHEDDEVLPGYASAMLAVAEADPVAVAFFSQARIIGPDGAPVFSLPDAVKRVLEPRGPRMVVEGEAGLAALLRGNFVMCPTLCFRRSALGARRFQTDLRQAQDLALTSAIVLGGGRLVGLPEPLYGYRRHEGSATARATEDLSRFAEESALFDELAARATALGWTTAARLARRKTILRLHLLYLAASDLVRLRIARAVRKAALALSATPAPGAGR